MSRATDLGRKLCPARIARVPVVCMMALCVMITAGVSQLLHAQQTPQPPQQGAGPSAATAGPMAGDAAVQSVSGSDAQPEGASQAPAPAVAVGLPGPPATKRERRQAESAYLAGAKKLDHNEPEAAEREFQRAVQLDPGNAGYNMAVEVARQQRLMDLIRQVGEARAGGDESKAQTLLAEARDIDPASPLVLEHAEPTMSAPSARAASPAQTASGASPAGPTPVSTGDASSNTAQAAPQVRIVPNLAGPVHLTPSPATQTFDLGGDATSVVPRVFKAYGIKAVTDASVEHKNLRFNMEEVTYNQAIDALSKMANIFLVPVDETTVLVAKNDEGDRVRLQRQLEETIYLQGVNTDQFNETVQLLKGLFDRIALTPQPTLGAIVVRAPEDVMVPLNETIHGLQEDSGEVVIEVRLYEVDTNKTLNAGANIPTAFGIYNVDQAAAQLVSQNSTLVQQAIAQGLISPTASNFEIAAALIASGLVKSSLLNSTIGVFGGGITQTGITETGSLGVNLGLNSSDSRSLDNVQLRVRDRETATFREGSRYPITSSTYTAGLSSSSLGSLSSLLSQSSSSSNTTTIPQVTYENLGVTLDATPVIQKSGRISMKLDLKIEALAGSSVNNVPVLANREFKSDLTVAEGQSALIASYVSSSEMSAMTGIPGLSELPGFQTPVTKNVQKSTTQLVVVITPHVVRRRSSMVAGPRIRVAPELASQ